MSSGVDLDLINYIDPNLTWKNVRKGPRSETRCPRKGKNIKIGMGSESSNISKNVQDLSVFESEKLGVAVLGEHFAEKTSAVPIKKRRLSHQSSSPPPRTPSLNGEASLSPEPTTPSPNHDEPEKLVHSKSASGQMSYSDSSSKKRANKKNMLGVDGTMNSNKTELTTRECFRPEDFSGIELLVAAACSSSIEDNADHVEPSGVEELTTPEGNDASRDVMKESVTASESEGSSVPENAFPVVQSLRCDNENDRVMKMSVPSKDTRFHWDLNAVMDEWEEPCFNPPPSSQGTCAEGVVDGGLQFQNLKKEACERREFDNMGREIESIASDEITSNKSDRVNLCAPSTSSTSTMVGQDDVIGDSRGQEVVQGSAADGITNANHILKSADTQTAVIKGHVKLVAEEAGQVSFHCQKSCKLLNDDKLASENHQNENGSESFPDEQRHPADGDTMRKVQEGYDSPYEDGELREPLVHAWEENIVENMENECVDFEFGNEYDDDFDNGEHSISENFVVRHGDSQTLVKTRLQVEKNVDAVPGNSMIQGVEDVSSKPSSFLDTKTPEGCQLQEICDNINIEGSNFEFYTETKSGHDERTFSGNMLHMEGSLPFDGLHRRGTGYMKTSRTDNVGEAYSRTERVFGSEKMMGRERVPYQGHGRNEVDCRWVDSAGGDWDSRNHYGYTRSRNVVGDSDGKPSGLNSHDLRQSRSYGQRGIHRPLNRRQSPTEINESYPLHRRTQPGRGFERNRGRSGFVPQGFRRGRQEEYHEPGPYYFERKERRFSPNFNRDSHISRTRRRSRSRSRSMSPIAWNMHNRGTRRHSPEFRTEGRVQEERIPFQKPRFSGDFDQGLISPPRGRRWSPQHSSRCFDDRKCMDGQYRERRPSPPVRMFMTKPRFDSVGYPERLKSGDFFRPTTRPGRFQQLPGGGHGPRNFDERSDDRRKPVGRHEAMNRVRRYDTGAGGVRRCRYDDDGDDDCFEPCITRNEDDSCRGPVRRAAPVSIREERSPPKILQEKLTADAPLVGEQDFDVNALTKEV